MGTSAVKRSLIIQKLERKHNLSPIQSETMVKTIIDKMTNSLSKGDRIEIRGFGSFEIRFRSPRKARNPKTGETVQTSGKYSIHFKPGKELKDRVNNC